jgi:arylsulfatase A-like enzyme
MSRAADAAGPLPRIPAILRLAIWNGVVFGMGMAALLIYAKLALGRYLHASPHLVWTVPLAMTLLELLGALVLFILPVSLSQAAGFLSCFGWLSLLLLYSRLHQLSAVILAAGLATATARLVARHEALADRVVRRTLLPLCLAVLVTATAVAAHRWVADRRALDKVSLASAGTSNVLLIVLDTVRSLSLSLYGYTRPTTPELARISLGGIRFDRAFSSAPWTLPSHAGILTGYPADQLSADWTQALDGTHPTLAEILANRGLVPAGFVANVYYCSRESGLDRGFAHYEDFPLSPWDILRSHVLWRWLSDRWLVRNITGRTREPGRKDAPEVNAAFLNWLDRHQDRPFFAFLNYYDAHEPYTIVAPFDSVFRAPRKLVYPPGDRTDWSPAEVDGRQRAYEASIAYLDQQIGKLIAELERRGVAQRTLIIITADHGEEFLEHGVMAHGNSLARQGIQVPLVLLYPGRIPAGRTVSTPVSLLDLPATILDILKVPATVPGHSLVRFWSDSTTRPQDPIVAQVSQSPGHPHYPVSHGPLRSVMFDGFRLIRDARGHEQLYDAAADSLETTDLLPARPDHPALERLRPLLPAEKKAE